jgi:circadian clock protein KaiC
VTSSAPRLLTTGVPGLDAALGGGLRAGSIVLLVGEPGSGKTILAQQLAHHRAAHGERVLFLIGFSETQDKLIEHGRDLSFFNGAALGREILFGNLVDLLRAGQEETEDAIVAMARQQHATLVILDGFSGMRMSLPPAPTPGSMLYSLGNKLALLGATTVVTAEGVLRSGVVDPEYTVADVIIGLGRVAHGLRDRRLIDINKVRGANPLIGRHAMAIDRNGITVYPRLEATVPRQPSPWSDTRLSTGVSALDELLTGGLPAGSSTLIAGVPGTGKTLLGLHFLAAGAAAQEPGLYLGFIEDANQIAGKAQAFGLGAAFAADAGVGILQFATYDLEADAIVARLRQEVAQRGVRRLVVDSAFDLQRTIDPPRQPGFLAALADCLRAVGVTTLFTYDVTTIVGPELTLTDTPLAALAENLILLRQVEYRGRLLRVLSILKMRIGLADHTLQEYDITPGVGLTVRGAAPAAYGWLTGMARPVEAGNGLDADGA